jgi:hypothetical protein
MTGRVRAILKDARTGEVKLITPWSKNILPACGRAAAARRYGNYSYFHPLKTNEGAATYGAVGDGSVTPQDTDIKLQNELARKAIGNSSYSGTGILIEFFFDETEANYPITNMGLFGEDATIATDSGTLMEYAFFAAGFTKTSSETLTVQCNIQFSQG